MAVDIPLFVDGQTETLGDHLNSAVQTLQQAVNIALQWRGAWNGAADYDACDVVVHNAVIWLSLQDGNLNNAPVEGVFWRSFTAGMATVAQLNALAAAKADIVHTHTASQITDFIAAARAANEDRTGAPVQDIAALRAVVSASRQDKQVRLVEDSGLQYRFNTEGTGTDDGDGTVKPNDISSGNGRWFRINTKGGNADTFNNQNAAYYLDRAHHSGEQAIGTVTGLQTALDGKSAVGHTHAAADITGLATSVFNETPGGTINGINSIFTTAQNFATGTTRVYLNGIRQKLTGDYAETGINEITFITAPSVSDEIIIDYNKA